MKVSMKYVTCVNITYSSPTESFHHVLTHEVLSHFLHDIIYQVQWHWINSTILIYLIVCVFGDDGSLIKNDVKNRSIFLCININSIQLDFPRENFWTLSLTYIILLVSSVYLSFYIFCWWHFYLSFIGLCGTQRCISPNHHSSASNMLSLFTVRQ